MFIPERTELPSVRWFAYHPLLLKNSTKVLWGSEMSQIGSFALLLALGLSAYSFLAGFLALFGKDAASARLGATARRAGIATFAAVLLAGIVPVVAPCTDALSLPYP